MKKLLITSLLLTLSFLAKAQESENPEFFNAADPTQLYTNLNFNAGTTFGLTQDWLGDYQINLSGDFAIKKFNFGFNVPFSNANNDFTGLGDIDLHVGYQLFSTDNIFKSSLIHVGVILPTSFFSYGSDNRTRAQNRIYFNYTGSIQAGNKFAVFPKIGVISYKSVDGPTYTYPDGSTYTPPHLTQLALSMGLDFSYQFNPKNFLQFSSTYENGTWNKDEDKPMYPAGPTSAKASRLLFSIKYQYAITNKAHLYLKVQNLSETGFTWESMRENEWDNIPGLFLGFQYFIK